MLTSNSSASAVLQNRGSWAVFTRKKEKKEECKHFHWNKKNAIKKIQIKMVSTSCTF